MEQLSILMGGAAGDGIKQAASIAARLMGRLGYWIFFYDDYPSLIRGGHNFSIVRASRKRILAHEEEVHLVVALNQETADRHEGRLEEGGVILFDSDKVEAQGVGLPLSSMVKEAGGVPIMRNTAALGGLFGLIQVEWGAVEQVLRDSLPHKIELNLALAKAAYEAVENPLFQVAMIGEPLGPVVTGNEAIALGAAAAGLDLYIAYPMTPASSILHFLAAHEERLGVVTVHPESEVSAGVMALGAASAGARTMLGTSGGGFALMTEALSMAAQSETPMVIVESQRAGPGTGVPTYTMQADLLFALGAGHGDIIRVVMAPGDADEALELGAKALDLAWKLQVPVILLSDKHLSESAFTLTADPTSVQTNSGLEWDRQGEYLRYEITESGVSPLCFPGNGTAVVKTTSYEHDQMGITTEEPQNIKAIQDKRLKKKDALIEALASMEQVKTHGPSRTPTALICWGSTKGSCMEAATRLGAKVIRPLVLDPFPEVEMKAALEGVEEIITVENNATGQLTRVMAAYGIKADRTVLRYDALPFTPGYLLEKIKEVAK